MPDKWQLAYMDTAKRFAALSTAQRLQVGSIVVKDNRIISIGYNGMPTGWDNNCEYREYDLATDINGNYFPDPYGHYPYADEHGRYALRTRPEVLHAEANAIAKLARSTESGKDADMYITHAPCIECAKQIYGAGIKRVFYSDKYRSDEGVDFLNKCSVELEQL